MISKNVLRALELTAVGFCAYKAYDLRYRMARESEDQARLANASLNPLAAQTFRDAATTARSTSNTYILLGAGLLGLTLWSWEDPNRPLLPAHGR